MLVCLVVFSTPVVADALTDTLVMNVLPENLQGAYGLIDDPMGAGFNYATSELIKKLDPELQQVVGNMQSYGGIARDLFVVAPDSAEEQTIMNSVIYHKESGAQIYPRENGEPFVALSEGVAMDYDDQTGLVSFTNTNDEPTTLTFGDISLSDVESGSTITFTEDRETGMVTLEGVTGDLTLGQTHLVGVSDGTFQFSQVLDEQGRPTGDYTQVEYAEFVSDLGGEYSFDYVFASGEVGSFDFSSPYGGSVVFDPADGVLSADSIYLDEVGESEFGPGDVVRSLSGDTVSLRFDDTGSFTQVTFSGPDAFYSDTRDRSFLVYPSPRNPMNPTTIYFDQPLPADAPANALSFYESSSEIPDSSLTHIVSQGSVAYQFQETMISGEGRATMLVDEVDVRTFDVASGVYVKDNYVRISRDSRTDPVSVRINPAELREEGYDAYKFLIVQETELPYIEVSADGTLSAINPESGLAFEVSASPTDIVVDQVHLLEAGEPIDIDNSRLLHSSSYLHPRGQMDFVDKLTTVPSRTEFGSADDIESAFRDLAYEQFVASGMTEEEAFAFEGASLRRVEDELFALGLDPVDVRTQARATLVYHEIDTDYRATRPYVAIIEDATSSYEERLMLAAVMSKESGGNPDAVSYTGAAGLMQVTSGTAKGYPAYFGSDRLSSCCGPPSQNFKHLGRTCSTSNNACFDRGLDLDPRFDPELAIPGSLEILRDKRARLERSDCLGADHPDIRMFTFMAYNSGAGNACKVYRAIGGSTDNLVSFTDTVDAVTDEIARDLLQNSNLALDSNQVQAKKREVQGYGSKVTSAYKSLELNNPFI